MKKRRLGKSNLEVSGVAELNSAVAGIEIRGARLPEQVLVFSGVEAPPKS